MVVLFGTLACHRPSSPRVGSLVPTLPTPAQIEHDRCAPDGSDRGPHEPPPSLYPTGCPAYPPWTLCTGPACNAEVWKGAHRWLEGACAGAACCRADTIPGSPIEVNAYLGRVLSSDPALDSTVGDDAPAINDAIECASSFPDGGTLRFAAGRYVLRSPLRPNHDNLTLQGATSIIDAASPPATGSAVLVARPCNPEQLPGAIQLSDVRVPVAEGGVRTVAVRGVQIRDLRIELTNGPRLPPGDDRAASNSGIQLNRCTSCTVERVTVRYAGAEPAACKPYNLDGITFAIGSSGTLRDSIVDGVPKAGIYVANNRALWGSTPVTIERVEVKNGDGPLGAVGISIVGADVTLRDCWSHGNVVHPATASATPSEAGGGLLISAPPGDPRPVPSNLRIERSRFEDNGGAGIQIASLVPDARPEHIDFVDTSVRRNGTHGLHVQAGTAITATRLVSSDNGYFGVALDSRAVFPDLPAGTQPLRVDGVTLIDSLIYDNGMQPRFRAPATYTTLAAIALTTAPHVTIDHGAILRTSCSPGTQLTGVALFPWSAFPAQRSEPLRIEHLDSDRLTAPAGRIASPYEVTDGLAGAIQVSTGLYLIESARTLAPRGTVPAADGSPTIAAPPGSVVVNTTVGATWTKPAGAAPGPTGWVRVP